MSGVWPVRQPDSKLVSSLTYDVILFTKSIVAMQKNISNLYHYSVSDIPWDCCHYWKSGMRARVWGPTLFQSYVSTPFFNRNDTSSSHRSWKAGWLRSRRQGEGRRRSILIKMKMGRSGGGFWYPPPPTHTQWELFLCSPEISCISLFP